MELPVASDLKTMDYTFQGQPFVSNPFGGNIPPTPTNTSNFFYFF